jgi:hypothetical protein
MPHLTSILAFLLVTVPAVAQSEAALRKAFEGKRVNIKIEMPATKWGIDVAPGNDPAIDFWTYQHRIKEYGTAIRPGDSVLITAIKVKEKLIEFQLGGGGYGTLFDETSTDVYVPPSPKTGREKHLEKVDQKRKRSHRPQTDERRTRRPAVGSFEG